MEMRETTKGTVKSAKAHGGCSRPSSLRRCVGARDDNFRAVICHLEPDVPEKLWTDFILLYQ